jgi:hypothetical protein
MTEAGERKWLIDITDPRFFIPDNADVIEFIRRVNPFAHSDVGSLLLDLGKKLDGAQAYSPSYKQYAYVVLHTDASRVFAIAYGQRGLAFRLSQSSRDIALADDGTPADDIGRDWVKFDPWNPKVPRAELETRLERWSARAFTDA